MPSKIRRLSVVAATVIGLSAAARPELGRPDVLDLETGVASAVAPEARDNPVDVVEISSWSGVPWHSLDSADPSRYWAGIGNDVVQLAYALHLAEHLGARAVSFKTAERKRHHDHGFSQGFDEVFPMFRSGEIRVQPSESETRPAETRALLEVSRDGDVVAALRKLVPDNGAAVRWDAGRRTVFTDDDPRTAKSVTLLDTRELRRLLRTYIGPGLSTPSSVSTPGDAELVVHLRAGDNLRKAAPERPLPVPFSVYDAVVNDLKPTTLRLVTMPPPHDDHPAISYLKQKYPGQVQVQHAGLADDFLTLSNAKHLIADFSTFSWMAGLLNAGAKSLYAVHYFGRNGTDYMPYGPEDMRGGTFPHDDPLVHMCVLEVSGSRDATRELANKDFDRDPDALMGYLNSDPPVSKTCWH